MNLGKGETIMMRLRELRKERKLTQRQVADAISTSTPVYCRYEKGEREPSIDTIIRLSDFFGVTCDYLLGRDTSLILNSSLIDVCTKPLQEEPMISSTPVSQSPQYDFLLDLSEEIHALLEASKSADTRAIEEAMLILNYSKRFAHK